MANMTIIKPIIPDKPTDKKLTFVEWLAKEKKCKTQFAINNFMQIYITALKDGKHYQCDVYRGKKRQCTLCELEDMLSNYNEYTELQQLSL